MSDGHEQAKAEEGGPQGRPGQPVVVVGVDGSPSSSSALIWAAEEARRRGAILRVVRVWEVTASIMGEYLPPSTFEDMPRFTKTALTEQIREVLGDHPEVELEAGVVEGPAARMILTAAADAELVVVGSRGRGGFAGLLLGSVSGQVVHFAPCPVTVVRQLTRSSPVAGVDQAGVDQAGVDQAGVDQEGIDQRG